MSIMWGGHYRSILYVWWPLYRSHFLLVKFIRLPLALVFSFFFFASATFAQGQANLEIDKIKENPWKINILHLLLNTPPLLAESLLHRGNSGRKEKWHPFVSQVFSMKFARSRLIQVKPKRRKRIDIMKNNSLSFTRVSIMPRSRKHSR